MARALILGLLLIAQALTAAPVYTDSGSASIQCQYTGAVPNQPFYKYYAASGGAIDLSCPTSDPLYIGPAIVGGANGLSAFANQGGPYVGVSSFDFKSGVVDTGLFTGSGPAQVTFTLDWTVGAGDDITAGEDATADFWFNGTEVWSAIKSGANWEVPQFITHQIVLTEPIQLGIPFSYRGDVEITGGGHGLGYAKSTLVIEPPTDPPTQVPEPACWALVGFAIVLLAHRIIVPPTTVPTPLNVLLTAPKPVEPAQTLETSGTPPSFV